MGISLTEVVEGAVEKFGKASVMKLTDKKVENIPVHRTGIPNLDLALGVGGLPKGRIVEIYGPESSGKTTTALTVIAQAQKTGAWVWYGDMEHSLDPQWAEKVGVDLDKMLISQPDNGEQCLEIATHMIKTGVIDIIVIDSVAALVPKAEIEGSFGDSHMGLQARLMSQAMRMMTGAISRTESTAIFINQIRSKIGIIFGNPEVTAGGNALKFYASIRIEVRKGQIIGEKINQKGYNVKFSIKKNKVAPPFKICEAALIYDNGFDFGMSSLDAGVSVGVIEKSGNTYSFGEIMLGKSKEKAEKGIDEFSEEKKKELYDAICGKIKSEDRLPIIDKIAKLEKKLLEEKDEEEKKRLSEKIVKLKEKLEEQKPKEEIPNELPKEDEEEDKE